MRNMGWLSLLGLMLVIVQGCGGAKEAAPSEATGETAKASVWLTDFGQAKAEAVRRQVPILADFSGSDWCGWCIRLDREVFSKDAFLSFAEDHVVLFLADFPSGTPLPEETRVQNERLAAAYGIKGFPTVLLLDADGKELARTGYRGGGAEAYVAHLREMIDR